MVIATTPQRVNCGEYSRIQLQASSPSWISDKLRGNQQDQLVVPCDVLGEILPTITIIQQVTWRSSDKSGELYPGMEVAVLSETENAYFIASDASIPKFE